MPNICDLGALNVIYISAAVAFSVSRHTNRMLNLLIVSMFIPCNAQHFVKQVGWRATLQNPLVTSVILRHTSKGCLREVKRPVCYQPNDVTFYEFRASSRKENLKKKKKMCFMMVQLGNKGG